jgi:hypothetical protein
MDERSIRRFSIGGHRYLSIRYRLDSEVSADRIAAWREQGLRILAYRRGCKVVHSPADLQGRLGLGDRIVVAGPEHLVAGEILG